MSKIISTLSVVLVLLCFSNTNAQRYMDEIFTGVDVTTDVTYGVNATVLYYSFLGEAVPEELKCDIYEPAGDTDTNRPLVLYFHTGNFLPHPQNQGPGGLRTDSATVELCSRLARMGYVVASCDYRLGWNPIAETQEERVFTLINAAYRGVQDCRTAIRYFRMTEDAMGNPYGIDPTKVIVWGQGTGGYIAFAAATLNNYVTDIASLPKFVWDPDGDGTPQPMVIEFANGNMDGTTWGINPGADLFDPSDDDTLCYPNWEEYDSNFNAMVNMGGAMGDISWLEDGMMPMISFQAPSDPFAPYGDGLVIVPGLNLPVVDVSGSYSVQAAANAFGNNAVFAAVDGDRYSARANEVNDGYFGLFPLVRPDAQPADSAPWEWWAPDNVNNANGLATNPDMSAEKGRMFCDSIQWYAIPRLACALDLPHNPCTGDPLDDPCQLALSINSAFGGAPQAANESGPYSNTSASGYNDPSSGWDCWGEPDGNGGAPSLDQSVWFWFEGDGNPYNLFTDNCGGDLSEDAYIELGDTQFALFSGNSCDNLVPVACNEDGPDATNTNYYSELDIETEEGVTYWLLVDGFNYAEIDENVAVADGQWCFQVTNTTVGVDELPQGSFLMFPNPANDRLTINAKSEIATIHIYNALGERVKVIENLNSDIVTVSTSMLSAGAYTVVVATDDGASSSSRLVIE